jgi:hypothetical protein
MELLKILFHLFAWAFFGGGVDLEGTVRRNRQVSVRLYLVKSPLQIYGEAVNRIGPCEELLWR